MRNMSERLCRAGRKHSQVCCAADHVGVASVCGLQQTPDQAVGVGQGAHLLQGGLLDDDASISRRAVQQCRCSQAYRQLLQDRRIPSLLLVWRRCCRALSPGNQRGAATAGPCGMRTEAVLTFSWCSTGSSSTVLRQPFLQVSRADVNGLRAARPQMSPFATASPDANMFAAWPWLAGELSA
jgi:hypothetical protein